MSISTSEENSLREQLAELQEKLRFCGVAMDNLQRSLNATDKKFQQMRDLCQKQESLVDASEREISRLTLENHRLRQLLEAANVSVIP